MMQHFQIITQRCLRLLSKINIYFKINAYQLYPKN